MDQPLELINRIRVSLNIYDAMNAWEYANTNLDADSLSKWISSNKKTMKIMHYVWSLDKDG